MVGRKSWNAKGDTFTHHWDSNTLPNLTFIAMNSLRIYEKEYALLQYVKNN